MVVSAVIVGLVPYNALDPDTPISSIFNTYGLRWAEYIITTGAVTALCASLMGALLPQPRILLAMARDGLLPSFFSEINKHTQAPVNSTIVTGIFIAVLSFLMDVSELAGMVSVGTLLAFTIVAISVLILRYVPPVEVSVSRNRQSSDSVALQQDTGSQEVDALSTAKHPLLHKGASEGALRELKRRKIASWCITLSCLGVLVLTSAASSRILPRASRFIASGVGAVLIVCPLVVLSCTDEADASHYVGHSGGFRCPWVPFLPVICVLINTYLLINLGASTWIKVSIWLAAGAVIYLSYGRSHSLLNKNDGLIS
ncbi:hypothetical protein Leryth_018148 [Lithospermum erythrorhizon]|nr:hypothetical protein Leryth_018148 [Lithospermum erythrorhizon]